MDKCKYCEIRISFGRLFDEHWFGEEDCPYRDKCTRRKEDAGDIGSERKN